MKIGIIGCGHVGLVYALSFANSGFDVLCMDVDSQKIEHLKKGRISFYEPQLDDLLKHHQRKVTFTTDIVEAIHYSLVIFITVGTPTLANGSADLSQIEHVANLLGNHLNEYKIIVNKSTAPIGSCTLIQEIIAENLLTRAIKIPFDILSNPEFLKQGSAFADSTNPALVVIGGNSTSAIDTLKNIYLQVNPNSRFICTKQQTAELIKYAANAFSAVKISFINELSFLAEKTGSDAVTMMEAINQLISSPLHCGSSYGGSCLPKDTQALSALAKNYDENMLMVNAAITANSNHLEKIIHKINTHIQLNHYQTIGILGLTFKANTDDISHSPSIAIIKYFIKKNMQIKVHCPKGMSNTQLYFDIAKIQYCCDAYDLANNCDVLIVATDWDDFYNLDFNRMRELMRGNHLFDLRNIYHKNAQVHSLFNYNGIGCAV